MLQLDALRRSFGPAPALDGLSFTAHAGRMLGFAGPDGAGKTTAMRIVLGVLEPRADPLGGDPAHGRGDEAPRRLSGA